MTEIDAKALEAAVAKCPWCGAAPTFIEKQPGGRDGTYKAPLRSLACVNSRCSIRPHTPWAETEKFYFQGNREGVPQGYHPVKTDEVALIEWNTRVLATVTPRGEGRPAIKPLDWEGFGFRWSAETPFGLYRVEADVGVDGAMWHSPCYGGEIRTAPSIPAAKSAAFARYEATILSTLLPAEAVIEAYNETHSSQTAVSETEDEGLESRADLTLKLHYNIGRWLDAEEALEEVANALREVLEAYSDNTGAEPSQSVFDRAIDHAHEVLAALSRAGGR